MKQHFTPLYKLKIEQQLNTQNNQYHFAKFMKLISDFLLIVCTQLALEKISNMGVYSIFRDCHQTITVVTTKVGQGLGLGLG